MINKNMNMLCQHGCGQPATHITKSSLKSGPFKGHPVHQCSKSHNSCPSIKAKKIATSLEKYGSEYPWQTQDILEKRNQTNVEKYGFACSLLNPKIQEKRKHTMITLYGVEEPTLNADIRNKAANAVKQSYIQDPSLSERQTQSKKEKYGENLTDIVEKNRATQIANGRWIEASKKTDWVRYKFRVKYLTKKTYEKFKHIINPENLKIGRCDYQVDHIYSIRHGFENNVDPQLIAHVANLRLLWHTENKSKHIRSDITLEDLITKAKDFLL